MSVLAFEIPYRNEWARKVWHLSSIWIPAAAWWLGKPRAVQMLAGLTFLTLLLDFGRIKNKRLSQLFERWFAPMMRHHERGGQGRRPQLTGTSWLIAPRR